MQLCQQVRMLAERCEWMCCVAESVVVLQGSSKIHAAMGPCKGLHAEATTITGLHMADHRRWAGCNVKEAFTCDKSC